MAIVVYVGEEEATEAFGVVFVQGEAVHLDGYTHHAALYKLRRNPQFVVTDWEPSVIVKLGLLAGRTLGHAATNAKLGGF